MLRYALKSMWARKTVTILFTLAILIALTISMVAVNISYQVNEGFIRADSKYDIIIGPNGSDIQLVMSSLFFSELPVGTMPYKYVDELKSRGDLKLVIPFAMGDNYRGNNIIGTSSDFLRDVNTSKGTNFSNPFEIVLGYNVAKSYNLQLGDKLISAHGTALDHINSLACLFHSHDFEDDVYINTHDNTPYVVVGILEKTNTIYDNVLFTDVKSIWEAHRHGDITTDEYNDELVTAILIRSENMPASIEVSNKFNSDSSYQAVHPTSVLRKLTKNLDLSKQIAFLLCGIILTLSFIIVGIMTFLMLDTTKKEVKTLRFLGISGSNIFKYIVNQTVLVSIVSVSSSIILSRAVLFLSNKLSSSMGIVINFNRFYMVEIGVILVVVALCIIPSALYVNYLLGKGLSNEV